MKNSATCIFAKDLRLPVHRDLFPGWARFAGLSNPVLQSRRPPSPQMPSQCKLSPDTVIRQNESQ